MELRLYRFLSAKDYTYGILSINGQVEAFTLEDEKRLEKVAKETRIPAGRYEIKFREVLSSLTKRYRYKYAWFSWHLHLQDVPGFDYVYIHVGNTDKHTDACILVANTCDLTPPTVNGFVGESRQCFSRIYQAISKELRLKKEQVFIDIIE